VTAKVDMVYLPGIKVRCDLCKKAYRISGPEDWNERAYCMHDLVRAMGWLIVPTPIRRSTHICPGCQGIALAWLVTRFDLQLEDNHA
jgi:hypothetical protein